MSIVLYFFSIWLLSYVGWILHGYYLIWKKKRRRVHFDRESILRKEKFAEI